MTPETLSSASDPQPRFARGGGLPVPLIAVDDVVVTSDGVTRRIRARKTIGSAEPYLKGHFPEAAIYPGVFLVESTVQAVSVAFDRVCRLRCLRSAKLSVALVPGDVLLIDADAQASDDDSILVTAKATKESDDRSAATMKLLLSSEVRHA